MTPSYIKFVNMAESPTVTSLIQDKIKDLARYSDKILGCEVKVSCPHRSRQHLAHRPFQVQVRIWLPGENIVLNRTRREGARQNIHSFIHDVFEAARRHLQDRVRIVRQRSKAPVSTFGEGKISQILPYEGFGFLTSNAGNEFYFSDRAVTNENFNRLKVGQKVQFRTHLGETVSQATHVTVI